ncbi:MAG: hypothetical protein HY650_05990 [Acidobacteria bacterium]|nr:hypothetical protein [Acidobacteriota bacterium]
MNCRSFRDHIEQQRTDEATWSHAVSCDRCRAYQTLLLARDAVLDASRWAGPIEEPTEEFYRVLNLRIRQTSAGEKDFWIPTISFARSFITAAVILLAIVTVLNLYVIQTSTSPVVRLDSYWRDNSGDGESIVLSDDAITHAEVLGSLVAMGGRNDR